MDDEENPWADTEPSKTVVAVSQPAASTPMPAASTSTLPTTSSSATPAPSSTPTPSPHTALTHSPPKTGLLLLIFIHGFKGSAETTFEDFPSRLSHLLAETHPSLAVCSLVYPTYDTRGSLDAAVSNFVEWLEEQVLGLESKPEYDKQGKEVPFGKSGRGGGRGTVGVVLCGHSMGGLVAADAALRVARDSEAATGGKEGEGEYWPNVVAVIAYDSPYWGVHPNVFRHQATKYISYAQQARDVGTHLAPIGAGIAAIWGMNRNQQQETPRTPSSSSSSSKWSRSLWTTGAFATAAAAVGGSVAAYYHREQINGAYSYLTDHFEYVANLWDDTSLRRRLNELVEKRRVLFHAYYNVLPAHGPAPGGGARVAGRKRTFIVLPPLSNERMARLVEPIEDEKAGDEVEAHVGMFTPSKNPTGYLRLVHGSAALIGRRIVEGFGPPEGPERGSDASNAQQQGESQVPLERDEGLRMGDEGMEEEEEEVKKAMHDLRERQGREGSAASVEGSL